jgi:hypothetical protein
MFMDDDRSRHVFVFSSSDDYLYSNCCVPTRHLSRKLVEHCNLQDNDQRRRYCRTFLDSPLAALATYIMELLFHTLLPSGGYWPLLQLSVHDEGKNEHWTPDHSRNFQLVVGLKNQSAVLHISSSNSDPPGPNSEYHPSILVRRYNTLQPSDLTDQCFYISDSSDQLTFDSFYYVAGHAYVFQCTTKVVHTVEEKGLEMMRELKVKNVTYIGVVPAGREPTFIITKATAQKYTDLLAARYILPLTL